jgi:dephospho-CoA kinase
MLRIGLTGGIGSGKSTVAAMLARRGAWLVDADEIARQTTAAGGAAISAIAAAFGPSLLDATGALDRAAMRALAFHDESAKLRLEAIVHPWVRHEMEAQVERAAAQQAKAVVLDIPLLAESDRWARAVDRVWVVDCSKDTQLQRVQQRNALPAETVERIIASQASRSRRRAIADVVIFNDGIALDALQAEVEQAAAYFGL